MVTTDEYKYFDRDISWLAFNKRVLLEALDKSVPIYERINFLSIFSSNLEEFYQVRVAGARQAIMRNQGDNSLRQLSRIQTFEKLTAEVQEQETLFREAWEDVMVPDLKEIGMDIYTDYKKFSGRVLAHVDAYFREEVFPFLQPVLISPNLVKVFIRDKRIYLCVHLRRKEDHAERYYMIKLPFTKVPRFLSLPSEEGRYTYTFLDEVVRYGLPLLFPGYDVVSSYSFKTSRDADILIDEDEGGVELAESIESLIRKRKIGSVTRFQYDEDMPREMLSVIMDAFGIKDDDLLKGRRHLQLRDLKNLPNPFGKKYEQWYHDAIPHARWEMSRSKIDHLLAQDEALFVPYTSFQYLIDTLDEACNDPRVRSIKLTQYRVADDSEVIDVLIKAANSGKNVTVFVELKARFDEENNLQTAARMKRHGVKIIYSLPGLKVHAKTCFIEFHPWAMPEKKGIACFSTGNFNESTAKIYSDISMFTSRPELANELAALFEHLENPKEKIHFENLLVASHGMVEGIHRLIDYEINEAKAGREARIILKMNSLEEQLVIDKLYQASEAGVKIDLLIRGICRVIPNQSYSKNITIIRLVDIYLEHARIWFFHHGGEMLYYISSADWMGRNLYRRIECATPVVEPMIKNFLQDILDTCLTDNVKAVYVDEHLNNVPKRVPGESPIRTQEKLYNVVEHFNSLPPFYDHNYARKKDFSMKESDDADVSTDSIARNNDSRHVGDVDFTQHKAKRSWFYRLFLRKKR